MTTAERSVKANFSQHFCQRYKPTSHKNKSEPNRARFLVHPPRVLCLSCPATCYVANNPNATHILLYYVKYVCKRPSCHKTKTILRIAGLFGASAIVLCLSCPATCHVTNNPNATHILLYYVKYIRKRPSCHKTKTILRIAGLFGASAESRTRNLPRRRRLFYPVELRVRAYIFYIVLGVFASEILREFCARQRGCVVIE